MKNDYILIYARRKTVGIRIAVDGSVVVRAPRGTSKNDIDAVVERHQGWIEKHRKTVLKKETLYSEADDSALEIKAREIILPLVRHYSALMGVTPSSIRFTGAKKRSVHAAAEKRYAFRDILRFILCRQLNTW